MKNLGAYLDATMSMVPQISNMTRCAYYYMRRISKIRCHLDANTCATVVHSVVASRLDYHNGLLTGISDIALAPLRVAQNNAA